ncbi:hypothetical protein, partial [Roseovarius sp. D22-M7]|uniref:hypothetical protein n=1 Tax=Roseovarius sp. D22-M7 TaxID=3127116 RepID=UPI00300FA391
DLENREAKPASAQRRHPEPLSRSDLVPAQEALLAKLWQIPDSGHSSRARRTPVESLIPGVRRSKTSQVQQEFNQ